MTGELLPWDGLDARSTLSARLAARVAREVVERRRDPGDWLTEADLASSSGASRTPAREAMLQLAAWGLVRLLPKKGAVVTTVSMQEREDLLNLRVMLEINAVEHVVDDEDVRGALRRDLAVNLEGQHAALEADDLLTFAASDYSFHARLIRAGGNVVVSEIMATLGPRFARLTYLAVSGSPDRLTTLLAEHRDLAEQAASGDAAGFARAVRAHVRLGHFPDRVPV